jgi:AcrR family transcriptional regulator
VPKLWSETIETHRRTVHDAILEATVELVAEHGLLGVTMSQIAEKTGIGRATLYKYFPDVESILVSWHNRQIAAHLEQLAHIRDQADDPGQRLEAVLEAYAHIHHQRVHRHRHEQHGADLVAFLHQDQHLAGPRRQLHDMIKDLVADAAQAGVVRDDVAADELADYCLNALQAAGGLPSKAAVRRLVAVTLAGLRAATSPNTTRTA